LPPGPSEPSSIPRPRKATSAGSPDLAAPSATATLAARTAPTASIARPMFIRGSSPSGAAQAERIAHDPVDGHVAEPRRAPRDVDAERAEAALHDARRGDRQLARVVRELGAPGAHLHVRPPTVQATASVGVE